MATSGDDAHEQVVLFVHGFPLDHRMWEHQLSGLSRHARLIAPDLPGFGASRRLGDSADPVGIASWADDLALLLDAMSVDRPVIFCGLSMGGYIGWEFWRRHPTRVRALVGCDTRAAADTEEVARGRRMMAARVSREGTAFLASAMLPKLFAPLAVEQGAAEVVATGKVIESTDAESVAQGQLAMAERVDATDWLDEIKFPTLLVVGSEDVITPPTEMCSMAGRIEGAEFFEIEGAGHMAPLEQPAVFNERLALFLGQVVALG